MSHDRHNPPDGYASPIALGVLRILGDLEQGHYAKVYTAEWCPAGRPIQEAVPTGEGSGGEGNGHDASTRVAVKMVHGVGSAAEEAWVLRSVAHPNIAPLLDYFAHDGTHDCLVFPLATCGTLADHATNGLPIATVADATRQLALALEHIHRNGYVHGDVKMENVLVVAAPPLPDGTDTDCAPTERRCRFLLTDFGSVARVVSGTGGCDRRPQGSMCFSPPECFDPVQRDGLAWDYGTPVDMWSLGCLMWEAATGECLPMGSGPNVLGRLAREKPADEWERVRQSFMATFAQALGVGTHDNRPTPEKNKNDTTAMETRASHALCQLLDACWIVSPPSKRPTAEAVSHAAAHWKPHLMSVLPEIIPSQASGGGTPT